MSEGTSPTPPLMAKDDLAALGLTSSPETQHGLFASTKMEKSTSNASSIGLGIMGAPGVEVSISTSEDGAGAMGEMEGGMGFVGTTISHPSDIEATTGFSANALPSLLSSRSTNLSPPSSKSQTLLPTSLNLRAEPESPYLPLFPTPNPMTNSPYTPFPNAHGTFPRSDYIPNNDPLVSSSSPTSSPISRNTNIMTPPSPASPAFMRAAYAGGNGGMAGGFDKWRSEVRKGSSGYGAFGDGGEAMIAGGGESPTKKTVHGMVADRPRPMLMRTPPTNALLSGPEILNADHFHPETSREDHTHEHDEEGDEHVSELPMSPHRLDFGKGGSAYSPTPQMSPPPLGRRSSGPTSAHSRPYAPQAYPPSPSRSSNLNPASSQTPPSPLQPSSHRVHARNLSLFFPEPGKSPPVTSPSFQPSTPNTPFDAPITTIPSPRFGPAGGFAYQNGGSLSKGSGFKFGAGTGSMGPPALPSARDQPKSPLLGMGAADGAALAPPPSPARFGKRGHHHKHSLSHNFFSFLDPTATNPALAEAGPSRSPEKGSPNLASFPPSSGLATPKPVANTFVSGAPTAQSIHTSTNAALLPSPSMQATSNRSRISEITSLAPASQLAIGIGVAEFFVGASIWVEGQATGSVGLTGLGYLVVFDSMGMAISVAGELMKLGDRGMSSIRRPFGSYRTESLLYFVQAIFLLFASVYIAKEAVEHVLITGHDHHADFNESRFPAVLLSAALLACLVGGGYMRNHAKLVEAVGTHFTAGFHLSSRTAKSPDRSSAFDNLLGNPFSTAIAGTLGLALAGSILLPEEQFVNLDKVLALAETFITFRLSYPASVALGQVLLQTSPPENNVQVLALRRAVEDVGCNHTHFIVGA